MPALALPASAPSLAAQPAKADAVTPIWPIVLVIYLTLLPREVRINVGENMIFADRLALMACMPWVATNLWRGVIKFVLPDWLVIFAALWSIVAMWHAYDLTRGLISGGSYAFDAIAGYYLARVSFRSLTSVRRALILCAPGFFLAGFPLLIESLSHHLMVRPLFADIFGRVQFHGGTRLSNDDFHNDDIRLGLLRGLSVWPHPILAGLHLATLLPIYWMSGIRGWPRVLAIAAALLSVFTISSAAFATLALGFALIGYDRLTRLWRELNWPTLVYAVLLVLVVVQITSNSGAVGLIIRFAALDPTTGYYRLLIWQYGTATVAHHPWLGIGFEEYERPDWMYSDSIDNHWLLWAVRYGVPAAAALLAAVISACLALARSIGRAGNSTDARFYRGILISLVILALMMFTVALQGGTLTWFTLLLGGCVGCANRGFLTKAQWRLEAATAA